MPATHVGYVVAAQFASGIVAGLVCGTLIARAGPVRSLQIAVACAILGLVLAAGGHAALIVLFAVLVGFAHGLVNPASSHVLMQAAPPRMRSLIFSIKQTGVPLGYAIAGLILPPMLLWMSWQQALLLVSFASVTFLFLLGPLRRLYDLKLRPGARISLRSLIEPMRASVSSPELRRFILGAAVFPFVQPCVTAYMVSFLTLELGYSLVAAGLVFAATNIFTVLARVLWGALADWSGSARHVLAGLGVMMGFCCAGAALFSPDWPMAGVTTVCILWGISAVGWNGVYLAEVARLAPEGKVGLVTGGSQVYLFSGSVIAPPLFGMVAAATGFRFAYLLLGIAPVLAGLLLLRSPAIRTAGPA